VTTPGSFCKWGVCVCGVVCVWCGVCVVWCVCVWCVCVCVFSEPSAQVRVVYISYRRMHDTGIVLISFLITIV
jgi:hypothetical protein